MEELWYKGEDLWIWLKDSGDPWKSLQQRGHNGICSLVRCFIRRRILQGPIWLRLGFLCSCVGEISHKISALPSLPSPVKPGGSSEASLNDPHKGLQLRPTPVYKLFFLQLYNLVLESAIERFSSKYGFIVFLEMHWEVGQHLVLFLKFSLDLGVYLTKEII